MAEGGLGSITGFLGLDDSEFTSGLQGALGGLTDFGSSAQGKAVAIGAGIAVALGAALFAGIDLEAGNKKLQAQLGMNSDEFARIGKTAGRLYAQNYGESMEGVNDALRAVITNIDGMKDASDETLDSATKKALNLESAFGNDLAGSTRTVATLMKTGLAKNADEAFDIITKGQQSSVNIADDVLDTFNEYSTVFRTMGIDGGDALGIMQQGLQGGARDADVIADSFKELLLRVQAGDANGGLRAIGLDAEDMTRKISMGGQTAKDATTQIVDGFNAVKDPAEKAQIGVALFGTKAEDAQKALGSLDLKTAKSDFEAMNGAIAGSADLMDETLGSSRAATLESIKRTMEGVASSAGTLLLPVVDQLATTFSGLFTIGESVVTFFTNLPGPLQIAIGVLAAVALGFTGVGAAMKAAFLTNPVGIAITGVVLALGWLVGASDDAAESEEAHKARVKELTDTLDTNTGAITENTRASVANDIGPERLRQLEELGVSTADYTEAILGNGAAATRVKGQIVDAIEAQVKSGEGYEQLSSKMEDAGVSAEDMAEAFRSGNYDEVNAQLSTLGMTAYDTGDGLLTITNNADGSTVVLGDMSGKATDLRNSFGELEDKTADVTQAQSDWSAVATASGAAGEAAGEGAEAAAGGLDAAAYAASIAEDPLTEMQTLFEGTDSTASAAADSIKFFNATVDRMLGINRSAEEVAKDLNDAIRETKKAFDDAAEATEGNAKALVNAEGKIDTTTEAGSKLYDGLQDIADAYDSSTTSAYDTAVANGNAAGALGIAQGAADNARGKFLELAAQQGITGTTADNLADSLGIVAGVRLTDKNFSVNAQGIDDTTRKVQNLDGMVIGNKSFVIEGNVRVSTGTPAAVTRNVTGQVLATRALGGIIPGFAEGGLLDGTPPTDPREDNLTAMVGGDRIKLQSGEFVQPRAAVNYYGRGFMEDVQTMRMPRGGAADTSGTSSAPQNITLSPSFHLTPNFNVMVKMGERDITEMVTVVIEERESETSRSLVGSRY